MNTKLTSAVAVGTLATILSLWLVFKRDSSLSAKRGGLLPSSVYRNWHSCDQRHPLGQREFEPLIITLRGWIHLYNTSEKNNDSNEFGLPHWEGCSPPDWYWDLEVDLEFFVPELKRRVRDCVNDLIRPGNILHANEARDNNKYANPTDKWDGYEGWKAQTGVAYSPPLIHVELPSWYPDVRYSPINTEDYLRYVPDPGWEEGRWKYSKGKLAGVTPRWPWNPEDPDLRGELLSDGDYVEIRGALVTDPGHHTAYDEYRAWGEWLDWTEVHPVDSIQRIKQSPKHRPSYCVAVLPQPQKQTWSFPAGSIVSCREYRNDGLKDLGESRVDGLQVEIDVTKGRRFHAAYTVETK